jgi:hypothetical protein
MYKDVRAAVDLCHRDGSLKRHVAADPGKYIHDVSLVWCGVCVCQGAVGDSRATLLLGLAV